MTLAISGEELAAKLGPKFPESVIKTTKDSVLVKTEDLVAVAGFLKSAPGFEFDFLCAITGVDYKEYFELVYQLTSLKNNQSLILKTQCRDRENPVMPSLTGLWQGADFQEREIYDLLGIKFEGHPDLTRIFLWDGFKGHPLRKDYTNGA
jgi:NADH-quinone oxidoreductase subunit C